MGILLPDSGTVELFGGAPDFARRSRVGYLPEERGVYEKMKVLDQLVFFGEIRGIGRATARSRAEGWLERLGLSEWASRKVQALSKGMQQKVQFISTVLHDPELLILDEPFSGLDPINQDVLEEIVREENERGKTILFSTHLMDQAERLCEPGMPHLAIPQGARRQLKGIEAARAFWRCSCRIRRHCSRDRMAGRVESRTGGRCTSPYPARGRAA